MNRYWRGNRRVEYVCKGYQRNGKSYCSSHRIHEETLDSRAWEWLIQTQKRRKEELKKLLDLHKMWALRKPILDAHILSLQKEVQRLESEIDDILMEKLRNLISTTDTWSDHKCSLHTIKKTNFRPAKNQFLLVMVRVVGLEPTRYAAQEPKSCV